MKVFLILILFLSGCLRVGPNFRPPVTQDQDVWTEPSDTIVTEEIPIPAWWLAFEDATLNTLIDYAMHQNYTLEAAVDRIAAARANLGFAIGEQYPQTFQLEGAAIRTHLSKNAPNTAKINRDYWDLTLGLRVVWELDFWGRFYRGVEAAYGDYLGSIDDFEDIKRLLISDIVLAYVELKTVIKRISILDSNIAIQYRSVQITEARYESGYESELDNAQAGALWKQTESLKEVLEIEQKQLITSLAILLGVTPEAFSCLFNINSKFVDLPKEAIVGFPAQILCRRPDLRRSLDLILSQNARVGIAVSDLYPRISFTGYIGFESTGKDFFSGNSLTFFYGPSFVWPFFSFGRLENRIKEQYALLCETIALYRNQVLVAYKEVEDALTFFAKSIDETNELEEGYAFAKRSVDISTLQYQEGIADYSRVLNSLQLQVTIEDQLAQARGNIGLAYANIYRALGIF
jgi:NodT family efflux transporter outer membrane factor (OMF) lipoprotein